MTERDPLSLWDFSAKDLRNIKRFEKQMTKNINEELYKECSKRLGKLWDQTCSTPGPLMDIISIMNIFNERLAELERKK